MNFTNIATQRLAYLICVLVAMTLVGCGDNTTQNGNPSSNGGKQQGASKETSNPTALSDGPLEAQRAFHLQQVEALAEQIDQLDIAGRMKLGGHYFMSGQFDKSIEVYDEIIAESPAMEPMLWQRGLALYYADEFEKGVAQFETHQTVNSADVENSVWHLLCAARISGLEKARESMIEILGDPRIPMREIYLMFRGELTPEDVIEAAETTGPSEDRRSQKYYAHLYIGLYYEMINEKEKSLDSLRIASELNDMPINILMGQVARAHLQLREGENEK